MDAVKIVKNKQSKQEFILNLAVNYWCHTQNKKKDTNNMGIVIPVDIIKLIAKFAKNTLKFNAKLSLPALIVSNDGFTIHRAKNINVVSSYQIALSENAIPITYVSSNTYQKLGFKISIDNKPVYQIKGTFFTIVFKKTKLLQKITF